MSRALFAVMPPSAGIPTLIHALHRLGITNHNISTLCFKASRGNAELKEPQQPVDIHATGQLRWALQGASSTGVTRRIARALAGMGMPESAARHYQELVRAGSTLLCVFCDDAAQGKQAATVLRRFGVKELASTGAPDQSEHALRKRS